MQEKVIQHNQRRAGNQVGSGGGSFITRSSLKLFGRMKIKRNISILITVSY